MIAVTDFASDAHSCILHNHRNIRKHIHQPVAPEERICHRRTAKEVLAALDKISKIAPARGHSISPTVRPVVPNFYDCYQGDVFALGQDVTSGTYSANGMIRMRLTDRSWELGTITPSASISRSKSS
jgi:hypothetical protein